MVPIEVSKSAVRERIWLASLIVLPYVSYLGLVIMLGLFVSALCQRGKQVWRLCGQRGLGWLTAGLLIISTFALNKGESFLQLTNFLPFFLFFGVLATVPSVVNQPFVKLAVLARWLLLTSVPMSVLAMGEFVIKFEAIAPKIQSFFLLSWLPPWLLNWIYVPDFGHRAHSFFSHPNMLAAYLSIVLGLGLGVVMKALAEQKPFWREGLALGLCAIALFCTGSRNGILSALVLIAIALYHARYYKWVMLTGLAASSAILAAVFSLGIGGRSLSLSLLTNDPRIGVWQLATEMIQQRPWLGWGFAGLRILYEPGSIPDYDIIFHAHNIWLFLASEAGIPVMVGFCIVIGTIYYDSVQLLIKGNLPATEQATLLGYLLAFASCLLFSLFDVALFDSRINILSWGLLSSLYVLSRHYVEGRAEGHEKGRRQPVAHTP